MFKPLELELGFLKFEIGRNKCSKVMTTMDDHLNHPTFLTTGSLVEVTSNEDGFNGAWYVATVIHPPPSISSPNHNLVYVEYHHIPSEDGRLREYANISYVRPSPVPDTNPPNFQLNDLVDAFYRDSWRTGVITTVVDTSTFAVTLRNPSEEVQFRASDLRIYKNWAAGRWFQPQKQGDSVVRKANSLIDSQTEQATPNIHKQSLVIKFTMKKSRPTNLDSNDKNSPNDEIINIDSDSDDTVKTRTQEKTDLPFVMMGLQCNGMTVSQGKIVEKPRYVETQNVAKVRKLLQLLEPAPLAVVEQEPGFAEKQNVPSIEDKLPNENTVQILKVYRSRGTKNYSESKGSINTDSPAQGADSQDASQEKADERLENDSTERNPECYESEDASYDQPPVTIPGPEGTVEQSSKETEQCDMDSGNLPFVKNTLLWETIESMEAFRMLPQKPHFRPLLKVVKKGAREGLAIGSMVTFATEVDKTCSLKFDDSRSTIEDCLETLPELESNGFDVEAIRERVTGLLLIKDKQVELKQQSKSFDEKIKEHDIQSKQLEEENKETERQIRELEERRKHVLLEKEKRMSEISAMKVVIEVIKQDIRGVGAEFDGLAAAPFVENNT